MSTLHLVIIFVIVSVISLGLFNSAHASCVTSDIPCADLIPNPTVQTPLEQFKSVITVNDTQYEIAFDTEHSGINTISTNLHSYIHNSLDMNITSDKQYNGSLTLTLAKDAMTNVFCITRSDVDNYLKNNAFVVRVDNNPENFTTSITNDNVSLAFDIPEGSKNATIVNQFVGMAVSPLVYFKGIPQTDTYRPGQDVIFNGTLVDACGKHLGKEKVYFTAGQLNVTKQVTSDTKGKFSINFTIPENIESGNYTSKIEMYEYNLAYNLSGVETLYLDVGTNNMQIISEPPLKQFKSGIAIKNIICAHGFQLVIRAENHFPACLKLDDVPVLIEQGWAVKPHSLQEQVDFANICLGSNEACNNAHDINIESIQMISPTNPGGPKIQMTLMNTGMTPITNLKATLHLGNDYIFDFHDVSESQPLAPSNSTSDTEILIGGGFTSEATYPLTISGIANNIPFSFTQNVRIPYTNENIATKITPENVCGKFFTAPGNQNYSNTVPVLLMNSNSTACAKLTFTIISDYGNCNGQSCQHLLEFNSTLPIGNLHYEKHGSMISVSSGKDYTNSFNITAIPETIDLANYQVGANFTVTYIITPLPNATGFYDQSIPKLACERYQLVVGHTADQVNATDFSYIDPLNPLCVAGSYVLTGVEISGMDYKYVTLRLSTLG